jgi:hypothetical protein
MHYFSNLFDKVLHMFRTGPQSFIRKSLNIVYTQQVFVMLVLLVSASMVILTKVADANRTSITNTY